MPTLILLVFILLVAYFVHWKLLVIALVASSIYAWYANLEFVWKEWRKPKRSWWFHKVV